jgi:hypothetical protein
VPDARVGDRVPDSFIILIRALYCLCTDARCASLSSLYGSLRHRLRAASLAPLPVERSIALLLLFYLPLVFYGAHVSVPYGEPDGKKGKKTVPVPPNTSPTLERERER